MQGFEFEQRDKYKRFYQASQDKSTVEPRFTYTDTSLLWTVFSVPGKSRCIFAKLNPLNTDTYFLPNQKILSIKSQPRADTSSLTACCNGPFFSEGKKTIC